MNTYVGKVLLREEVVLHDVEVCIEEAIPEQGKLMNWQGYFVCPENQEFNKLDAIKEKELYSVVLSNGRKGRFFVTEASPLSDEIKFGGSGPLE